MGCTGTGRDTGRLVAVGFIRDTDDHDHGKPACLPLGCDDPLLIGHDALGSHHDLHGHSPHPHPYLVAVLRSGPAHRTPHALFHHTVIIGNGELSRALVESLSLSEKEILIVEENEDAARELALKHRRRAFVIWGDYDDPQTWEQAWIKNADFVILCENERTTASIVLGIRGLTSARIISIVDKISFDRYLRYAGAEYVLSPSRSPGGFSPGTPSSTRQGTPNPPSPGSTGHHQQG